MADRLEFEIDVELETGLITGHAGVPGLIEAFRQTGTAAVIDREIKLKHRKRGLSASEMVESLLAMWAAGGLRISINSAGQGAGVIAGSRIAGGADSARFPGAVPCRGSAAAAGRQS